MAGSKLRSKFFLLKKSCASPHCQFCCEEFLLSPVLHRNTHHSQCMLLVLRVWWRMGNGVAPENEASNEAQVQMSGGMAQSKKP